MSGNASFRSGDEPPGCPVCGNRAGVEDSDNRVAGTVCPHCGRARPLASSPCGMDDYWREMGWSDDAGPSTPPCETNVPTAEPE